MPPMQYTLCNLKLTFIRKISYMWNVGINRGINITKVFAMHIKLESIHGIKLSTFEKAMVFASL